MQYFWKHYGHGSVRASLVSLLRKEEVLRVWITFLREQISTERKMMDVKVLLYLFWHGYGERCLSVSEMLAVRKEPSHVLVKLVCYIRLRIAIHLAREALRAFQYADHFLDDAY